MLGFSTSLAFPAENLILLVLWGSQKFKCFSKMGVLKFLVSSFQNRREKQKIKIEENRNFTQNRLLRKLILNISVIVLH